MLDSNPVPPVTILPNTTKDIKLVISPKNSGTVLFLVADGGGLSISDTVITLTKDTFTASSSVDSLCLPQGKVAFTGLSAGIYGVTVSKSGYTDSVFDIGVTDSFITKEVTLLR